MEHACAMPVVIGLGRYFEALLFEDLGRSRYAHATCSSCVRALEYRLLGSMQHLHDIPTPFPDHANPIVLHLYVQYC